MVKQRDVLSNFASRSAESRSVTVENLVREFGFARQAACGRLNRLWRERLIEAVEARPARARFRLEPAEAIHALHFRITARGRQRLRWYEQHDESGDGGWLGFR